MTTNDDTPQDLDHLVTSLSRFPGQNAATLIDRLARTVATTEDGGPVKKTWTAMITDLLFPKLSPLISTLTGAYRRYRQGDSMNPLEMALAAYIPGHPDTFGKYSLTEAGLWFAQKLGWLKNPEQYDTVLRVVKEARSGKRDNIQTYLKRLWTVFGEEFPSAILTDADVSSYILTKRDDAAKMSDYDTAMNFGEILIRLHEPDAEKMQAILCFEAGRNLIKDGKNADAYAPLDRALELGRYVAETSFYTDLADLFSEVGRLDKVVYALMSGGDTNNLIAAAESCLATARDMVRGVHGVAREELLTATLDACNYLREKECYKKNKHLDRLYDGVLEIRTGPSEQVEELRIALSAAQEALEYGDGVVELNTLQDRAKARKQDDIVPSFVDVPADVTAEKVYQKKEETSVHAASMAAALPIRAVDAPPKAAERIPPRQYPPHTPIDLRDYTDARSLSEGVRRLDVTDQKQLIDDLHMPRSIPNAFINLPQAFIENYFASMNALSRFTINDIFSHDPEIHRSLESHLEAVGILTLGHLTNPRRYVLDYQTMLRTDHATGAQLDDLNNLTPPQLYELAVQYGVTHLLNYTPEHPNKQHTAGPKGLRALLPTVIKEKPEATMLYAWYSNYVTPQHFYEHHVRSNPTHRTDICVLTNGTDTVKRGSIDVVRENLGTAVVRVRYTFGVPTQEETEKMLRAMARTEDQGIITYL